MLGVAVGRRSFLGTLGTSVALVCATACAGGADEASAQRGGATGRCGLCGMRVTRGAAFSAGARTAANEEVLFDSVKCMFRWLGQHADATAPWVTEHLTRSERPARDVFYVLGTDLQGPMGHDLVPVDTAEHAEQLRQSHHGTRVVRFAEVDAAIIDATFRM
jgi:nitrous oxide reductase accessory protein NosL